MKIGEIICALSILILGIITLLALIIGKYLSNKYEKNINDKFFVIHLPKSMLVLGGTSILFPLVLWLGILWFEEDESLSIAILAFCFFGFMAVTGIYLIVTTLLHKIVIQGNKITVYPVIRKPYTIEFNDIVSVKIAYFVRGERISVTTESKKFSIDYNYVEYEHFVKLIYRKVDQRKICIKR